MLTTQYTSQVLMTKDLSTSDRALFDRLVGMVAPEGGQPGLVAASTARIYRDTFRRWADWCAAQGVGVLDLHFNTVGAFLASRPVKKGTAQRELAALRTIAKLLMVSDYENPARRAAYESLRLLRLRNNNGNGNGEAKAAQQRRRALTPSEAERLLAVWRKGKKPREVRNRAIVATLLLTGLRRAELAAVQWADIDFERAVLFVAHGKGDREREATIFGQEAIEALTAWRKAQGGEYAYVFTAVKQGGEVGPDKPITGTALWQVVDQTAQRAGVGHVKPHDLRRTLATELIETGSPVHHAKDQLGHARASTTLDNYVGSTDALTRRKAGKLRYG